jgi:hypothetical protein
MQLPDAVVACFTMNRQSIDGVHAIMRSIKSFRSPTVDGSKIGLFPMATRIENAEKDRLEIARTYARNKLAEFTPARSPEHDRDYWDDMEVSYRPFYAFEEVLSAFGDATGATRAADTMLTQMEAMAQTIAGNSTLRMPETLDDDRKKILARYALGTAAADRRRPAEDTGRIGTADTLDDGSTDVNFLRGLLAKEQIWRKNDFDVRYLLSSRELELLTDNDRKKFGRNMAYYLTHSQLGQLYFRRLGIVFAAELLVLASIIAWLITLINERGSLPPAVAGVIGFLLFAAWMLASAVGSTLVTMIGNPPYGVTWLGTLRRLATGQVSARSISDYNPDRNPITEFMAR